MDVLIVPAIAIAAYLLTRNAPPPVLPPDRVVLLPEADGKVGKVVVTTAGGEQVLDTAYAGAQVDAKGTIVRVTESEASVRARYGALLAAQPPRPQSFVLYFASGTELTAESQRTLEQIKSALAGRPAPELTVIGHTDRVGKVETNDALSLKRATAVRDMLAASGVHAAAMDVAGRGEREPLVSTADEVAEPRNRRVEINIR